MNRIRISPMQLNSHTPPPSRRPTYAPMTAALAIPCIRAGPDGTLPFAGIVSRATPILRIVRGGRFAVHEYR